jgi:hypothetical protein
MADERKVLEFHGDLSLKRIKKILTKPDFANNMWIGTRFPGKLRGVFPFVAIVSRHGPCCPQEALYFTM